MTPPRSPVTRERVIRCGLVSGDATCDCPEQARLLSDAEIETLAGDMFVWQQRAAPAGRTTARRGLDGLLAHARRRGPSTLVAELLRIGIMLRILGADLDDATETESLLAELSELAEIDGDVRRLGEVAVLRAHRTITFDICDNALPEAAAALTILSEEHGPGPGEDPARWAHLHSRTLNGLVLVLLKLGCHELADDVSQRAIAVAETDGSAMERLIHQLNRVRLQLSWALRLERGGRDAAAVTRFVGAAQTAHSAAVLWGPALGRAPGGGPPPATECSIIGAAYALRSPGPEHLDLLLGLQDMAHFTEDRIVLAIATARCLMAAGQPGDAAAVLAPMRNHLADDTSEGLLVLALHREFARADGLARGGNEQSDALARYATALEGELWALREARITALRSHSAHHRLTREYGAVTAQALQDPLTGLPNRRALDLRLVEATGSPVSQPCAVALIDLDRFKDVNDARSHAAGDAVLRAVAGCLRTTLRGQDLVARYGGDEFVVVMPGTPLTTARAALARATEAVAALPADVAAGVTMSIGVVRAPLGGEPATALAAADAAMYQAKNSGGNAVVCGTTPGMEHRDTAAPDPRPSYVAATPALPAPRARPARRATGRRPIPPDPGASSPARGASSPAYGPSSPDRGATSPVYGPSSPDRGGELVPVGGSEHTPPTEPLPTRGGAQERVRAGRALSAANSTAGAGRTGDPAGSTSRPPNQPGPGRCRVPDRAL